MKNLIVFKCEGNSMQPMLDNTSIVIVNPNIKKFRIGEIVCAKVGRVSVVHRIVEIDTIRSRVKIKGDSSRNSEIVKPQDIIGRAEYLICHSKKNNLVSLKAVLVGRIIVFISKFFAKHPFWGLSATERSDYHRFCHFILT